MPTALNPGVTTTTSSSVAITNTDDTPATPHPAYTRMLPRWEKCRALWAGTEAIREGGTTYLPKYELESDGSYETRKILCAVFNGFSRTVKACVGMILAKDPELGEDMPATLVTLAEDVDLAGTHFAVYLKIIATDAMIDGHAGTLVDYPRIANPAGVSLADERAANVRPYFVRYLAEDILKVVYGKVDGVRVIVLLVLREVVEEIVGRFGVADVTYYRVYRRNGAVVEWEEWAERDGDNGATQTIDATPIRGINRIPFSLIVAGDRVAGFETRPPLENLADLNLEHHATKTNIRHLESLSMVPTQVRIGARPDAEGVYPPIVLGPSSVIEVPITEGVQKPVYWHSPDISVLEPGNRSLQDIKADMGAAGLAFLSPDKRVAETAEAKRIDSAAQNATISTVSRAVQDHAEEIFAMAAQFIREPAGSITVNRDFETTILDAATINALGELAAQGKLSIDTLHLLLERGRVLPEGFDREDELRRILTENAQSLEPEPEPEPEVPADDEEEVKAERDAAA